MLVVFDIDDTLVDHSTAVRPAVSELYGRIESPLTPEAFQASWLAVVRDHYPRYLSGALTYEWQRRARIRQPVDSRLSDRQADELFEIYFNVYEAGWRLFPDVGPCLYDLAAHRLGIISNGNGTEQRDKLRRTGITDHFELVHISADRGYAKPATEIFRRACETARVRAREAVYIGDLYDIDAVGARRSGLHGVWLDRRRARLAGQSPPIIGGLGELNGVLRSCAV